MTHTWRKLKVDSGINNFQETIPRIKRARDYHLYDFKSRRYLDLCLDGGRALLGHKHGGTVNMMKNSLEKGLAAAYPSVYEGRLLRQVRRLYPGVTDVRAGPAGVAGKLPVVRPFEDAGSPESGVFELILPLPGSGVVRVVCSTSPSGEEKTAFEQAACPGWSVPGYLLSGLCRAAADLAAFAGGVDPGVWAAFDSPLWKRSGPWLFPAFPSERYPAVFSAFLGRGILISPFPDVPSCAPYRFTEGEIKPIKDIEGEFSNGG
jgi:hypothetical protein